MRALYICDMVDGTPSFPVDVQERDENNNGGYHVVFEFLDFEFKTKAIVQVDTTDANHAAMGAGISKSMAKGMMVEEAEAAPVEGITFLTAVDNQGPL